MCYVNQSLITSVVLLRFELCEGSHTPVGTNSSNEFRAQDIDIFYKELKPWWEESLGYNPTHLRFVSSSKYLGDISTGKRFKFTVFKIKI